VPVWKPPGALKELRPNDPTWTASPTSWR